jgi:hypothetical protein
MIRFDAGELADLAADLGNIGSQATRQMVPVFKEAGDDLAAAWADNARQTAGVHGKHYPASIDAELLISTDIAVEVGPNPAKPQGRMSFENGSVKQPPHLDGQRAADVELPKLDQRIAERLDAILSALDL